MENNQLHTQDNNYSIKENYNNQGESNQNLTLYINNLNEKIKVDGIY